MSGPFVSAFVAEFLIATTLLMALVLLVRPVVRRVLGAGAAYAIWLVPVVSMLIPRADPLPGVSGTVAPMQIMFATAADVPAGAGWLIWFWAAGALLFAGWHVIAYQRFLSRALAGAERLNASGTPVFVTDAVNGPAAAGLHKWRIFVPRDFETRYTPAERELAWRHELRHLSAGHLWANACAIGMLALHWFNPLAYFAFRAFREDQELSCDAAVIATAGPEDRAAYGSAMVKSAGGAMGAAQPVPLTTCPMTRADTLKRRLSMIRTHRKTKRAFAWEIAAVGLVAAAGSMLTATSGIAAEPVRETSTVIVKRLKGTGAASAAASAEIKARCGPDATKDLEEALGRQKGKPVKVRIVGCDVPSSTPAARLVMLERARTSIADTNELESAVRVKILAAMDSEIAALKAAR